jgi:hypothetical protein
MAPLFQSFKDPYHVAKEHFKDRVAEEDHQQHETQTPIQREPEAEMEEETRETSHHFPHGVINTEKRKKRNKFTSTIGAHAAARAMKLMSIGQNKSSNDNENHIQDDLKNKSARKRHDFNHDKAAKELRPDLSVPDKKASPESQRLPAYHFPDTLREVQEGLETLGSPSRRSRHVRQSSYHDITFRNEGTSAVPPSEPEGLEAPPSPSRRPRHVRGTSHHKISFRDESASEVVSSEPEDIPPVPPIPEQWREEWEKQQEDRRRKQALTSDEDDVFAVGGKKLHAERAGRDIAASTLPRSPAMPDLTFQKEEKRA